MQNVGESRLFAPYRALGLVSGNVRFAPCDPTSTLLHVSCAVGNSVHTYAAPYLNLIGVSEALPDRIRCIARCNKEIVAGYGRTVVAFNVHSVGRTYGDMDDLVDFILVLGDHVIGVDGLGKFKIWEYDTGNLYGEWIFGGPGFKITAACHPATYLNKFLLGSEEGMMKLVNIKTGVTVHEFSGWNAPVTALEQSTAVDVVGIGLKDGRILLHNVKFDETLMEFKQDWGSVTSIAFRTDGPALMITGSSNGQLAVWDLEKQRLANQVPKAHKDCVISMFALPSQPTIISASSDNCIKSFIFDMTDGGGRVLRFRTGHSIPPTFIRFHPAIYGNYVISAGGSSDLRMFHTVDEIKNASLGEAGEMRRLKAKQRKLKWDEIKYKTITYMASDTARENGWDNLICCHHENPTVTTWSSKLHKRGVHNLCHQRFANSQQWMKAVALCCAITTCGNFAIIGYSTGHVDVFNIQSGLHRGSFVSLSGDRAHKGSVRGLACDGMNRMTFTGCSDGKLNFWDFHRRSLKHCVQFPSGINKLEINRDNDLVAIGLDNMSLAVVDTLTRRVVRLFENIHCNRINDICFTPDGRWVLTTSLDCTLKVWDLPSSTLVDVLSFERPCVSVDFSPSGDQLATIHAGQLGVYLWVNKCVFSPFMTLKPLPIDYEPPEAMGLPTTKAPAPSDTVKAEETEELDDKVYVSPEQIDKEVITYSGLPAPRWASLIDLDLIKARNKPIEPVSKPEKAPFFLPTISNLLPTLGEQPESTEKKPGKRTRLELQAKMRLRSDFAMALESWSEGEDVNEVFALLKQLSPAAIDVELRTLSPYNGGSTDLMKNFMLMIDVVLSTCQDFELASACFSLFVKIHRSALWEDKSLLPLLERVQLAQKEPWQKLDNLLTETISMVQYMKSTVL